MEAKSLFVDLFFSIIYYSEILTAFKIVVHIKESAIEFLEIAKSKKYYCVF
jgi:hypothetical protein